MKRWPMTTSFLLFIALCVSAAYWAMQLFKPPLRAVAAPPTAAQLAPPNIEAAAALFGGHTTAVVASNFQLKGVVVASIAAESVAILSANGKPAQAVRINSEVLPGVTVKEINRSYVLLLEGGAIKRVELPVNPKRK
jgi:general secretion pathway protein C